MRRRRSGINKYGLSSTRPDAANQAKHGVSLALAAELDWDAALGWIDDRFEYAELRMIALAPKTRILYYHSRATAPELFCTGKLFALVSLALGAGVYSVGGFV